MEALDSQMEVVEEAQAATSVPGTSKPTDKAKPISVPPATTVSPAAAEKQDPKKPDRKRTIKKSVDPDSGKEAPDPKRSNIPLNKTIKIVYLKAIYEAYEELSLRVG